VHFVGGEFIGKTLSPTITGNPTLKYYGGIFTAIGNEDGISTSYGGYFSGTGSDTNYGVYSAAGLNYFAERAQFVGGLRTKYSEANVSDPPTDAELDSAFGTPATVGSGFVGVLDDNSDDTDVWLCYTSDTSWFYLQGTKAV